MLIVETGLSPAEIENMSERLLQDIIVYKSTKSVTENGGHYDP